MKNTILEGAATLNAVQSSNNKPSGNTKETSIRATAPKHSVSRIKHVDYTATNRNAKPKG